MDILAKFIEKEERVARTHDIFTFESNVGSIYVSLEDNSTSRATFKYVVEARIGVTSEFRLFLTRFFAQRYFNRLKKKYGKSE